MSDNPDQLSTEALAQRKREGALQGLEALAEATTDVQDIDPDKWVGIADADETGYVEVDGVRLKIAPLTDEETNLLLKRSRKPDPRRPQDEPKLDSAAFRLGVIAFSLNKANPGKPQILPSQLASKKTGTLTTIQTAIMALSGMDTENRPNGSFFG